jgi:hypothetical protein
MTQHMAQAMNRGLTALRDVVTGGTHGGCFAE